MAALRTQSVPALERGIRVLECLAGSRHGLSLSQITRLMNLPKSTVHSILLTFERSAYIQRDGSSNRYRLGSSLFRVANQTLLAPSIQEHAAPILRSLMDRTRLTVHMAALVGDELVLTARISFPGLAAPASHIGKRMDFHCTALGKAVLAHMPQDGVERLIQKHGMLRHNENTIISLRRLFHELELIRVRGYAVDDEEEEIGVRCIGCAVPCPERLPQATISLAGRTEQLADDSLPAFATLLKTAAASIAKRIT